METLLLNNFIEKKNLALLAVTRLVPYQKSLKVMGVSLKLRIKFSSYDLFMVSTVYLCPAHL